MDYWAGDIILSQPYLNTETILYINYSVDPTNLDNKIFAAVKGGNLPEGIKEENTIYFNDREEAINAVEMGKADYGFGNEYSLAFYVLQNGYKDIITIPRGKEKRAYCIGLTNGNEILLSIINKSIEALSTSKMQAIVLDVASQVERKITFSMIIDAYGKEIFGLIFLMIMVLLISIFLSIRAKNRMALENKRHEILSRISNECLFEYHIKSGNIEMSESFYQKFKVNKQDDEGINILKNILNGYIGKDSHKDIHTIKLPLSNGEMGVFKIVSSYITDNGGDCIL